MQRTIEYTVKNQYGNDRMFVVDKEVAHYVALISGKKTLDHGIIEGLQGLGFQIEEVPNG